MLRRLLQDRARPGRISRTKATLLGGGLTANVLAQAVLVVARMFGYELDVTEAELATVVSVLSGLVAMWFQREATAASELAAREAKYHASEAARSGRAALGLALAALLLPAVAGAAPVDAQAGVGDGRWYLMLALAGVVVIGLAAVGVIVVSSADIYRDSRRTRQEKRMLRGGKLFALAVLLLLPSAAIAQAPVQSPTLRPQDGAWLPLSSSGSVSERGRGLWAESFSSITRDAKRSRPEEVFSDGFESGDLSAWSNAPPGRVKLVASQWEVTPVPVCRLGALRQDRLRVTFRSFGVPEYTVRYAHITSAGGVHWMQDWGVRPASSRYWTLSISHSVHLHPAARLRAEWDGGSSAWTLLAPEGPCGGEE